MRRRVLHARIRARIVYACFEIQNQRGLHPERKAMSTVVSEVLESMVNSLIKRGELASINDEEADRKISEWLSEVGEDNEMDMGLSVGSLEFDTQNSGFGGMEPETSDEDPDTPDEVEDAGYKVGEEIVKTISRIASEPVDENELFKDLEAGEEESPEGDDSPLPEIPPWEKEGILSEYALREEVKNSDELAELCFNEGEAMTRALQVVYSNIPRELWGTPKAKGLVEQILPTVERHLAKKT